MSDIITITAPVNIAVIKYWGKRDEELILPLNDSVSATLDTNVMCAKTSVCARPDINENEIWLNKIKESFNNKRLQNCLNEIKRIARVQKSVDEEFLSWNVRIYSENNFPTAAGLASSAAGYACLVTALAILYKIKTDISTLARLGSGSACRSVYGGFVRWHAGVKPDGSDSIASQIANSLHWPDMRVIILVVADTKKHTSSSKGMQCSVATSELLQYRVLHSVPKRVDDICTAIQKRDFAKFAEITMKDSNQFHAVCLDTYPPCVYMRDISHSIVEVIHRYNEICGEVKVAYTFDAGPNACLYLLEKDVPEIISLIKQVFPTSNPEFIKGLSTQESQDRDFLNQFPIKPFEKDLLKYLIYTKVGDGLQEITDGSHLLDINGQPVG
ncbi:diphosphomevalonate decarboxylase [Bicyclus anynana]|uniref:Diphosphomevalonate decarboxylase n=1 Tax=Bicyclus anynana TaxID=110368 RepID=A0A6J1ML56_BICAN|nr:diphosphomevalonate decarboxylase [Bicyclus anynana]